MNHKNNMMKGEKKMDSNYFFGGSGKKVDSVVAQDEVQQPRQKKNKKPLIIAVIVAIVAVIAGLLIFAIAKGNSVYEIGGTAITQKDIDAYQKALDAYVATHPGTGFGDDTAETAKDDLVLNAALKAYAAPEKCGVTVTARDILTADGVAVPAGTDANALLVEKYGVAAANNWKLTRAENTAYENMLGKCIIKTKKLFAMKIDFDTNYFNSLSKGDTQVAYDSAKAKLQNDILPLFDQGLSSEEIAKHADDDRAFGSKVLETDDEGFTPIFNQQAVLIASNYDYTPYTNYFHDVNMTYPANPGELVSLNSVADELNVVGGHTGLIVSKAGAFVILRLEDVSGDDFSSWKDFLDKAKSKSGNFGALLVDGVKSSLAKLANALTPADAYAANCTGSSAHVSTLNITIRDSDGAGIPGVTVTNTQPDSTTCDVNSSGTTSSAGTTSVLVNCNSNRHITVTLPAGYTFADGSSTKTGGMGLFGVKMKSGDNVVDSWYGEMEETPRKNSVTGHGKDCEGGTNYDVVKEVKAGEKLDDVQKKANEEAQKKADDYSESVGWCLGEYIGVDTDCKGTVFTVKIKAEKGETAAQAQRRANEAASAKAAAEGVPDSECVDEDVIPGMGATGADCSVKSWVRDRNSSSTAANRAWSSENSPYATIFARPTDDIQFKHDVNRSCWNYASLYPHWDDDSQLICDFHLTSNNGGPLPSTYSAQNGVDATCRAWNRGAQTYTGSDYTTSNQPGTTYEQKSYIDPNKWWTVAHPSDDNIHSANSPYASGTGYYYSYESYDVTHSCG
ncbi:MAG: carboxypeptidase-like regulatory domain-containing protein, partial [Candidatus Nomurabacteria bacterium]|nr:carboxypeptidase-like regulatory domain-containing protein [Candidatus Nomurabacteria bacterium]